MWSSAGISTISHTIFWHAAPVPILKGTKKKKIIKIEENSHGLTMEPKTGYRPSHFLTYLICFRAAKLPHFTSDGEPPKNYSGRRLSIKKRAAGGLLMEC